MIRIKYLISGSLVVILSLFLVNCTGLSSQPDEVDPEPDLQEEIEAAVEEEMDPENDLDDRDYIVSPGLKPASDPSFDHQVDMKVNGIIEENKGEEWWVLD